MVNKTKGKRNKRRTIWGRKAHGISKSPQPKTYHFKRSRQEIIRLGQGVAPSGWSNSGSVSEGGIGKAFAFQLNDLNDNSDFTNLFKYYKINSVRVQIYFSNSIPSQRGGSVQSDSQLILFADINNTGTTTGVDNTLNYLDSQTAKKFTCLTTQREPIDLFMKMKLANTVYNTATNSDYTLMNPKWISTDEQSTPHYGMNLLIQRVSGQDLSDAFSDYQSMRIIYTYNIECKKVQ